ncbi:formyl transferase, partial [Opisthorchis viverrini]
YSTWPRCAHSAENTVLSRVQELRTEFERSKRQPAGLLGLIISFGRFLPTGMITLFDRGCINVHPSLLPRWRGPCPLFHTLVVGDRVTGVTVIRIPTEQHTFDSGPILYQHAISLEGTSEPMTVRQLTDHLSPFSIEAMFQVLLHPSTLSGVEHGSHCQQSIAAQTGLAEKRASRPTPEMGRIDWCSQSAPEIVRLWHALQDSPVNVCTEMAVLKKRGDSGVAQIRLSGTGPLVVPCLTNIAESSGSVMDETTSQLHEAAQLLRKVPSELPHGTLVYLRTQLHSTHSLMPFAFVSCKSSNVDVDHRSWLAICAFKVRWPGAHGFRPLTALEFHNGYLTELDPMTMKHLQPVPRGFHVFHGFRSLRNPLWPLPEPWEYLTPTVQLPDSRTVARPHPPPFHNHLSIPIDKIKTTY